MTGSATMMNDKYVIGAYLLLLRNKDKITWQDIVKNQRDALPDDDIPFDASLYNSARQLCYALHKSESIIK